MDARGDILVQLKSKGLKITRTRRFLAVIFQKNRLPLSEAEIRTKLLKLGVNVNKTTIYRELAQLRNSKFVKEIEFGDGKKRFELNSGHHHHLVCTKCMKVEEVELENELAKFEKEISKIRNFEITNHALEFFGFCKKCK